MARSASPAILVLAAVGVLALRQFQSAFVGAKPAVSLRHVSPVIRLAEEAETAVDKEVATDEMNRIMMSVQTPEGSGLKEAVAEVVLPSASGQLGVLAGHAPMMTAVDTGVLRYKKDGTWFPLVVMSGFAKVENNQLSILCNDIEQPEDIDMEEAKKELEEATSALGSAESKAEKLKASSQVKKASARVQAVMFQKKK